MKEKMLLREGSRDNLLLPYLQLIQKKEPQATLSQLKQALLSKFTNEANIRSLSLGSNFYLAGIARYYFNGDLTQNGKRLNILIPRYKDTFNQEICQRLDALIGILRDSYIDSVGTKWEQPEDFGTLPIDKLLRKYNKKINQALGIDDADNQKEARVEETNVASNNYTFDIMYSYDDCKKYHRFTEPGAWCITYAQQHYDGYTKRQKGHFVIFLREGYESVPRRRGNGFPLDDYGLSMLAVLQSNNSPKVLQVTTRYNHGAHDVGNVNNADHALNEREFLNVIGADESILEKVFQIWKQNVKDGSGDRKLANEKKKIAIRSFKYAQMMLNNGQNPKDIFDRAIPLSVSYTLSDKMPKFNKCITAVDLNVNGTRYTTICDRGKLMYDYVCIELSDYAKPIYSQYTSNRFDAKEFPDLIKCEVRDKVYSYYSMSKHKFITVDGKTKFRQLNGGYNDSEEFTLVMTSLTQVALLNLQTCEPVILPNGSPWFERIDEIGDPRTYWTSHHTSIRSATNVVKLTYDSAAGESYVYDLRNKRFIDIDSQNMEVSTSFNMDGLLAIEYKPLKYKLLYDINQGQYISLNGVSHFQSLDSCNKEFIYYVPLQKEVSWDINTIRVYDTTTKQDISWNGEPIHARFSSNTHALENNYLVLIPYGADRSKGDPRVFYNMLTRQLYINKNTNTPLFKVYSEGGYKRGPIVYDEITNEKVTLPLPNEMQESISIMKNNIIESFNNNLSHKSLLY